MSKPNYQSELVLRRKELDLTQQDIADAVGATVRTVSYWEQGSHVPKLTPMQAAKLCKLLRWTIEDLADYFETVGSHQD
ncbi:MAG: helix-turn-helix domain-containing protein [Cyanobacteria bacterium P01_D01_bin.56]